MKKLTVVLFCLSVVLVATVGFSKESSKSEEYQESCQGEVSLQFMSVLESKDYNQVKAFAKDRCAVTEEHWRKDDWKKVQFADLQGCLDAAVIMANTEGVKGEAFKKRVVSIAVDRCDWIKKRHEKSK